MKNQYDICELDIEKTNIIRAEWLECIECNEFEQLELVNSHFDHIIETHSFGNIINRSNLSTNVSLKNKSSSKTDAIVEIIFSWQGSKSICKIMDVMFSPEVTQKDNDTYVQYYNDVISSTLAILFKINLETKHGLTKIYAKNDLDQEFINLVTKKLNSTVKVDGVDFKIQLLNKKWLAFEKVV